MHRYSKLLFHNDKLFVMSSRTAQKNKLLIIKNFSLLITSIRIYEDIVDTESSKILLTDHERTILFCSDLYSIRNIYVVVKKAKKILNDL